MAKAKRERADRVTRDYPEFRPFNLQQSSGVGWDPEKKFMLHRQLMKLSPRQLEMRLEMQVRQNRPSRDGIAQRDMQWATRILDTGGTSTGNVLPRVDLEQTIAALFVHQFPVWDRIRKGAANGLKHTFNVSTATGAATDAQLTATSDLANAQTDVGTYAQEQTVNIAIFDTLRGVSLKELYAVQQSGMTYSPETEEMLLGTTRLKSLIQRQIFQGNASVSSGAGASTELGAYNVNGFDGLRLIVGGLGSYNANATRVDRDLTAGGGPFSMTQGVNYAAAQAMNNGGMPSMLWGSPIALNKYMNEQEGKQRTEDQELIPGVKVPAVSTVAGILPYVYAPGSGTTTNSAVGTYNRTADNVLVEDVYALDETMLTLRWLGSEDIQVLEIPIGVDTQLSRRFILFGLFGLQVTDQGLFQSKLRVPVNQ